MTTSEAEDRRLEVLISDYQMVREDERSLIAVQATIISVATALLGVLPVVLQQTCSFDPRQGCYNLPDFLLAAAPLVPLACLAFLQALGLISIVRSYYSRALEEELQTYTLRPLHALGQINPASYLSILNEIMSLKRGRAGFRLLVGLILGTVLIVFGGLTVYIFFNVDLAPKLAMILLYVPLISIVAFELGNIAANGRGFFQGTCESYLANRYGHPLPAITAPTPPAAKSRSVVGYLLLPRPDDAGKMLIAPVVFGLLVLAGVGQAFTETFLLIWIAFEYLIYSARYQWNDIRGLAGDLAHPERANKPRLPTFLSRSKQRRMVALSSLVVALRLGGAVAIGVFFGLLEPILWLLAVTVVVAVAYEAQRSASPPSHLSKCNATSISIWLLVAIGYASRAAVATFGAGLPVFDPFTQTVWWTIAALGAMVVFIIWALEGASFCFGTFPTSSWCASIELLNKPHLGNLLYYTSQPPSHLVLPPMRAFQGSTQPILRDRGLLATPWNIAGLFATFLGTVVVLNIPWARSSGGEYDLLLAEGLMCVGFVALAYAGTSFSRILVLLSELALTGILGWLFQPTFFILAVPLVAVSGSFIALRDTTFRKIRTGPQDALASITYALGKAAKLFVGNKTWREIR